MSYFKSKLENAKEMLWRWPVPGTKDDRHGQEEVNEQRK